MRQATLEQRLWASCANPKPLKACYAKLTALHVEELQDSLHSNVLRQEVNTQSHLHVLLPLLDVTTSAPMLMAHASPVAE
eukprot:4736798-Amphidinium_carterae.1